MTGHHRQLGRSRWGWMTGLPEQRRRQFVFLTTGGGGGHLPGTERRRLVGSRTRRLGSWTIFGDLTTASTSMSRFGGVPHNQGTFSCQYSTAAALPDSGLEHV